MKELLFSLFLHASLVFVYLPPLQITKKAEPPKIEAQKESSRVSVKLISRPKVKISPQKKKKKINKPKQIAQQPKQVQKVAKKKIEAVDGKKVLNEYVLELRKHIESKKHYPRKARRLKQHGLVTIAFKIAKDGSFTDIRITTPSRYNTLNSAAFDLINKISKFKPLPNEMGDVVQLDIPLRYVLNF